MIKFLFCCCRKRKEIACFFLLVIFIFDCQFMIVREKKKVYILFFLFKKIQIRSGMRVVSSFFSVYSWWRLLLAVYHHWDTHLHFDYRIFFFTHCKLIILVILKKREVEKLISLSNLKIIFCCCCCFGEIPNHQ